MWYLFIPTTYAQEAALCHQSILLQELFTGYTNNPFIFKSYVKQMKPFGVINLLEEDVCFKSESDCIKALQTYYTSIHPMYLYGDSDELFSNRNKLFVVKSKRNAEDILVVNDVIYERFHEMVFSNNEIRKLLYDINRLCNALSTRWLYQYIRLEEFTDVQRLLQRMYEIWKDANDIQNNLPNGLFIPSSDGKSQLIWDIFDETHILREFIASSIFTTSLGIL